MKRKAGSAHWLVLLVLSFGCGSANLRNDAGTDGSGGNGGSDGTGGSVGQPDAGRDAAAPFCGDGFINGTEMCDSGGAGSTDLGSCDPECTGYYEKKIGRVTNSFYPTNLGGI